jgi:hypothetical protein
MGICWSHLRPNTERRRPRQPLTGAGSLGGPAQQNPLRYRGLHRRHAVPGRRLSEPDGAHGRNSARGRRSLTPEIGELLDKAHDCLARARYGKLTRTHALRCVPTRQNCGSTSSAGANCSGASKRPLLSGKNCRPSMETAVPPGGARNHELSSHSVGARWIIGNPSDGQPVQSRKWRSTASQNE